MAPSTQLLPTTVRRVTLEGAELLLPLVYAELFRFPLSPAELARFVTRPLTPARARELLQSELGGIATERDGYVALAGSEAAVERRKDMLASVAEAWRAARARARLIGLTPFVRGLMVTGSLSHDCFSQDADIDYLVLVAPRRIFTVFAVLGTVQRLTSVQTLCPNYYLATDRLALPERDYFIAREVLAAAPVLGGDACLRFQNANRWAFDMFPNAEPLPVEEQRVPGRLVRALLERLLAGRAGDVVEALLRRLLISRIAAHYGQCGVPVDATVVADARSEFRLRFHARLHRERIMARLRDAFTSRDLPIPETLAAEERR